MVLEKSEKWSKYGGYPPNSFVWKIAEGKMVEIMPLSQSRFNMVKELLTRMGKEKDGILYQQCHIFQKRGRYFISHYKHLLEIKNGFSSYGWKDAAYQNSISLTLENWGHIDLKYDYEVDSPFLEYGQLKVASKKDLEEGKYKLDSKYHCSGW